MKHGGPWTRFVLLQLALVLAVWLSLKFWDRGLFLLYPAALGVGSLLMAKSFPKRLQDGMPRARMVNTLVLATLTLAFVWGAVLMVLGNAVDIPPMGVALMLLWTPSFAVFSCGSLAFQALGPFRARLSQSPDRRSCGEPR